MENYKGYENPTAGNLTAQAQAKGQNCSPQAVGLTKQHTQLLNLLKHNHTGRVKAITSGELCQEYERYYNERMSRRTLRKLKFELNTDHGAYICSGENGYFIAASQQEIDDLERYLYAWIKSISHEVKIVKSNYFKTNVLNTQIDLFTERR